MWLWQINNNPYVGWFAAFFNFLPQTWQDVRRSVREEAAVPSRMIGTYRNLNLRREALNRIFSWIRYITSLNSYPRLVENAQDNVSGHGQNRMVHWRDVSMAMSRTADLQSWSLWMSARPKRLRSGQQFEPLKCRFLSHSCFMQTDAKFVHGKE